MNRNPEDQLDRTSAADPQFNVALEASAGTGKTRVLVDRYARLIQEGADPRHILAITFTRKAAGEMKNRIIEELRKTPPLWSFVRERLFDIHIATIDAFCLGLLKEFPLEAGLDPDTDLLDEVDTEQLARDAVDDVLADTSPPPTPDLAFLVSAFGEATLRRGMRDFLASRLVKKEALSKFVHRSIPLDLRLDISLAHAARGLAETLGGEEGVNELRSSGPGPRDPRFNSIAFALERSINPGRVSHLDIEQVADYFLTREGAARQKLSIFKKSDFTVSKDYERHRDLVLARAPGVREVYRLWSTDRDRYAVREIWRLYEKALNRFSRLKEARRGLDFTDILVRAVDLLEKRGEFSQSRFRLESRYHHVLIDEFQDTNKFQWRLITALIDSWGEGAGLVQDTILREQASGRGQGLLTEPTVFIVGDRKQSIYGWRDARVEIMEDAAQHLERLIPGRGKRLRLRQSFRAHGSLLAFLNDVFAEMPQVRDQLEWTFRYRAADHFPILERHENEHRVGLAVRPDFGQAAAAVADEIARLLVEEDYHPKDIAILFRSRTHYREYQKALTERGVPTYVYRGLGFFDSPEVRDIQALVRFLAEPGSELRAGELARSRFIGFTDTGLALISSRRPPRAREEPLTSLLRGNTREDELPPTISKEDESAARRAIAWVPSWLDKVGDIPPSDLIQLVLDETDYAAYFAESESGAQGWENLKKILELVRRAQNRGYLTFARLAEYLENAAGGDESLAVLEAVDAVSLMTIHAAKGLEFDAVFVVNLDQKTRSDTSLPRILESSGEAIDVHALVHPDLSGPQRALEEEKRLLYVALTRARRDLVLSAAQLEEVESQATLFHLLPASLRLVMQSALTTKETALPWEPRGNQHTLRVLREQPEPRRYRTQTSSLERHLALDAIPEDSLPRVSVSSLVREQTGEEVNPWAVDPIDLAVGGAVHRLFEYDVPVTDALEDIAKAVLPDLSGHDPSERARAIRKAADLYARLRQQPELQVLLTEGRVLREVPFVLHGMERTVYGAIDSLVLSAERAVVIDYKTGKSRPEHQLQMELYLEAVRALFPGHEAVGLVFYPQGSPLRVRPPEDGPGPSSQLQLW